MLKVATVSPNEPYREYKDVERVYSGSTEIDKILDKNGNVLFAVNKEVEGTPAITYKGKEENNLKNYRIYGQTVDGESVGDRTGNLFDENTLISPIGSLSWYFDNHYLMSNSNSGDGRTWTYNKSQFKFLLSAGTYCLSFDIPIIETTRVFSFIVCDDNNTEILFDSLQNRTSYSKSFTINNSTNIGIVLKIPSNIKISIMLNEGSTALPYEPYGYKVPVTVSNDTDTLTTPIYLPEPIKMVGDEVEYVDYEEQKQHRVRKNLLQNIAASKTISGVTFTVNADGSVTCNGTNTANSVTTFNISTYLLIGTYIINGCPKNGSLGTYSVDLRDPSNWYLLGERDTGLGFTFTNNTVRTVYYVIHITPGYTCDNLTFYPMVRTADIVDDTYEPYIENTEVDVTLPALPVLTGTNTLTVGTEVQPSNIHLKGRIKEIA